MVVDRSLCTIGRFPVALVGYVTGTGRDQGVPVGGYRGAGDVDVFSLRDDVIARLRQFIQGFLHIRDERIRRRCTSS